MPAKDIYHNTVKNALIKDGWTITHDPLRLKWGNDLLYVDLGAEQLLTAKKEDRKIAVEVKSFVSYSNMADLENALGQYILYRNIIEELEPETDAVSRCPRGGFCDHFRGISRTDVNPQKSSQTGYL